EIVRSDRTGRTFAVLFVDVNDLKQINDRFGHLAGSRALKQIAGAIQHSCRATDTPARFGGDEFAVVLTETGRAGAEEVLHRLSERLTTITEPTKVSVSGGVAVYPEDGATPAKLMGYADQALYRIKGRKPKRRARGASSDDQPDLFTGTG